MRAYEWFKILILPILIFGMSTLVFFVYPDFNDLPKEPTPGNTEITIFIYFLYQNIGRIGTYIILIGISLAVFFYNFFKYKKKHSHTIIITEKTTKHRHTNDVIDNEG